MPGRRDTAAFPPPPLPAKVTAAALHAAAQRCRACDLYEGATQAVLGEGPASARVVLVGEQPGDREDIEGHPFVGPAGRILGEALERAGIAREDAYVTNAVKHFRYRMLGPRVRIGESRGTPLESDLAALVTVTVHPSSILRVSDADERHRAMDEFVGDLGAVAGWIADR